MDTHLGLMSILSHGDFVTSAVALLLIGMSLASWIVILIKALEIVKYIRFAKLSQDFWRSNDSAAALDKLGKDNSNPFRALALDGREAAVLHRHFQAHLHDAVSGSLANTSGIPMRCTKSMSTNPRCKGRVYMVLHVNRSHPADCFYSARSLGRGGDGLKGAEEHGGAGWTKSRSIFEIACERRARRGLEIFERRRTASLYRRLSVRR